MCSDNLIFYHCPVKEATKVDHRNPTQWAQMGQIYLKMGQKNKAKEALMRTMAYKEDPQEPIVVFVRLAQLLAEEGDWLESRRHFLLACERCPTSTAWLGVGIASLRLGELQEVKISGPKYKMLFLL